MKGRSPSIQEDNIERSLINFFHRWNLSASYLCDTYYI